MGDILIFLKVKYKSVQVEMLIKTANIIYSFVYIFLYHWFMTLHYHILFFVSLFDGIRKIIYQSIKMHFIWQNTSTTDVTSHKEGLVMLTYIVYCLIYYFWVQVFDIILYLFKLTTTNLFSLGHHSGHESSSYIICVFHWYQKVTDKIIIYNS